MSWTRSIGEELDSAAVDGSALGIRRDLRRCSCRRCKALTLGFLFLQLDFRRFRRSSCRLLGRVMQHRPRASLTRYEASSVFPSLGGIWTSGDPLPAVTKAVDHLAMRPEVQAFVADGPPSGWEASEGEGDRRDQQLGEIARPVTKEEAKALVSCFGPDDCYGVA